MKLPSLCPCSLCILKTQQEWFVLPRTHWWCRSDKHFWCSFIPPHPLTHKHTHTAHPPLHWGVYSQSSGFASAASKLQQSIYSGHCARCCQYIIPNWLAWRTPISGRWRAAGGGWPYWSFLESPLMDGKVNNSSGSPQSWQHLDAHVFSDYTKCDVAMNEVLCPWLWSVSYNVLPSRSHMMLHALAAVRKAPKLFASAGNLISPAHLWRMRSASLSEPHEGKFHSGAGCRLTSFVSSCLCKTALVVILKGGVRDNNNILLWGRASHCHVYHSNAYIFHSPRPPPDWGPTGFDQIPRYTLLAGLADRWMQRAITSRNRHTFTSLSIFLFSHTLLLSSLSNPHIPPLPHIHKPLAQSACCLSCAFKDSQKVLPKTSLWWCYSKNNMHSVSCSHPRFTARCGANRTVITCPVIHSNGWR